jgi:hypothetical protein
MPANGLKMRTESHNTARRGHHAQVWVKVNAPVDEGIAAVVEMLNRLPGLRTIDSCEGIPGKKPAHVYFNYGDWKKISRFAFAELGPELAKAMDGDAVASVEVFNGSDPMGKLSFDTEATPKVASVLKRLIHERP